MAAVCSVCCKRCKLISCARYMMCLMVATSLLLMVLIFKRSKSFMAATEGWQHSTSEADLPTLLASEAGILSFLGRPSSDTVITAERLYNNSYISQDVYMSVLTTPKHHESKFSYQLMTWMQTFNPRQVRVVTDASEDKWIKATQRMGFNVIFSGCPTTTWHNVEDIRCKTGRQFEEFYKAKENGESYSWYCHADDDVYFNAQSLARELGKYDPHKEHVYLGQWLGLTKLFFHVDRLKDGRLLLFPEAKKKQGILYAQGSAYCVSAAIMFSGAERYLRGKKFEKMCAKLGHYDDVCVGAVIEAILGNNLTEHTGFQNEVLPRTPYMNADKVKELVSFSYGTLNHARVGAHFNRIQDRSGYLSYHCLLHPEVSWCS